MKYTLTHPCDTCPFRRDVPGFLDHRGRAQEIADSITHHQQSFPCHKTIDHDSETGEGLTRQDSQHCAGAMILLEKINRPNQMMRIAERIRLYDRRKLDMEAPVFDDVEEFVAHHEAGAAPAPRTTKRSRRATAPAITGDEFNG